MICYMKRFTAVVTAILMTVCIGAVGRSDSKPFVIPELKSWDAGTGAFIPEESFRIAVPSGDAELLRVAGILASDWETLSGYRPKVISEKGGKGDITGMNPGEAPLVVDKDGGQVDAITASTITTRAFLAAVNAAYAAYAGQNTADGATGASQQIEP